jgi:hypothetical protein
VRREEGGGRREVLLLLIAAKKCSKDYLQENFTYCINERKFVVDII